MGNAFQYGALFMSFAFGVIGMSVGINTLVKSNDLKDYVKRNAPPGVTVTIDTHQIFDSGVVLTVGCALLALTSLITAGLIFLRRTSSRATPGKKYLLASLVHYFWVVWIFASLVAYDVIARNRQAKVTAFLAGQQLPDSIVQEQERALGVTRVYWPHEYIKLLAILPWFAFLFGAIAGAALLCTGRSKPDVSHASQDAAGGRGAAEEGKESTEKRESAETREHA